MTFATGSLPLLRAGIAGLLLALAGSTALAADGPALYEQNCAKCHGKTGNADTWRGRLTFAENFTKASFQQGLDNDEILAKINRGPGVMPSFEKKLSLEERKALVQVLRSFGANAITVPPTACCSAN